MIGEGTKQFDLYDFFSIFIPGAGFLLVLAPFIPHDSSISPLELAGLIIIGGFIFGRMIHASRLYVEDLFYSTTHRDDFIKELDGSEDGDIPDNIINEFYRSCQEEFPELELDDDRDNLSAIEIETIYSLVRSTVHMDARGRSRTFQAILDFYASLSVAIWPVFFIYFIYGIIGWRDFSVEFVEYEPYISTLGIDWLIIVGGAYTVLSVTYILSSSMRRKYRSYFIEYLLVDFIVLHTQSEPLSKTQPDN
jgi:hypothetical protein